MVDKDTFKTLATLGLLIWLGLLFAPVIMAAEAWHKIDHPTLDFLFTDATSATMAYQEIHLEPISVWYPDTQRDASQQPGELQQRAADYFQAAFKNRGLTVVAEPTPASIIVHIELIDLTGAIVTADLLEWARGFRFRVQPGRMTLVAELRDSASGRVLARMADLEDQAGGAEALWSNVDQALENWGQIVAASIEAPADNATLANAAF